MRTANREKAPAGSAAGTSNETAFENRLNNDDSIVLKEAKYAAAWVDARFNLGSSMSSMIAEHARLGGAL